MGFLFYGHEVLKVECVIVKYKATRIQLFRERLSEKNVHATIPKGNKGYDQYTVPDIVAVELSFVAFL